jgi:hypothetical protein
MRLCWPAAATEALGASMTRVRAREPTRTRAQTPWPLTLAYFLCCRDRMPRARVTFARPDPPSLTQGALSGACPRQGPCLACWRDCTHSPRPLARAQPPVLSKKTSIVSPSSIVNCRGPAQEDKVSDHREAAESALAGTSGPGAHLFRCLSAIQPMPVEHEPEVLHSVS